jgi:hypothetical protein
MSLYKNRGQEGKIGPAWELLPVGGGCIKRLRKGEYDGNILDTCMKMEKRVLLKPF